MVFSRVYCHSCGLCLILQANFYQKVKDNTEQITGKYKITIISNKFLFYGDKTFDAPKLSQAVRHLILLGGKNSNKYSPLDYNQNLKFFIYYLTVDS